MSEKPQKKVERKKVERKKVLMVSEYYPPHWTGIAKAFHMLAQNLMSQGHEVTVLTTQYDSDMPVTEMIDGVKIIRSSYQFKLSRTHYSLAILGKFFAIIEGFDTVVINSPNSNILLFSLIGKIYRKELVIFHQGDLTLPRMTGFKPFHIVLEKVFDVLSIPSFLMANITSTYTEDYAKSSRIMKYSLYSFRPYIPSLGMKRKVGGKPSPTFVKKIAELKKKHTVLLGIAGRFVEEKAYDNLLLAISHLKTLIPNFHIVFAGKKIMPYEPFYDRISNLVQTHTKDITFLGLLDAADLQHFYASIDLFVIPSRSDCFPVTQIEATQAGCPIVVTDIPGARMLVKSSGFGLIAKPEDPQNLADTIANAISRLTKLRLQQKYAIQFLKKYENFPLS